MPRLKNLFEPLSNGSETAQLLAELLNVKISATTLVKEIEEHPNYPSLLSISDLLNNYGIENIGIKIDPAKLEEIPVPFVTTVKGMKRGEEVFTIVKEIGNNAVHFFDPEKHDWITSSYEDFLRKCTGLVLIVQVADNAGEKGYDKKILEERKKRVSRYLMALFFPTLIVVSSIIAFIEHGSAVLLPFIFSVLTIAGATCGILLLWYELDKHNPMLKQICSSGKKVNCGAVLESNAAKIWGISWTTIGFSYFTGILLLLLFLGIGNKGGLFLISWVNATAVPYVVFSIFYQWKIAKQWCALCLSVQGILLSQLAITILGGWHGLITLNEVTPGLLISSLTAFSIPFIAITVLLPALKKAKERKRIFTELQQLKHNEQIFEAMLQQQKMVTESTEGMGITLGNPNAPYKLIKVCNPYCAPCAKAHKTMEDLLHGNPNVQIQIIFTATNKENDYKAPPVKHLLAIAERNVEAITKTALDKWYLADVKDYKLFADKYPMNGELKQQTEKIAAMEKWCDKVEIGFTPTFYISTPNSSSGEVSKFYQLPKIYNVEDLKYFFSR
jgi:uncharacterized membrane protein